MAVYERTYTGYKGYLTPEWSRFLAIPAFSFRQAFSSRWFLIFFSACCLLPTLVELSIIYVLNNDKLLMFFGVQATGESNFINADFFLRFVRIQATGLGFFVALWAGPPLISTDLAGNGLPMYFSRPLSRSEYIAGKICILFLLLSLLSWVPNLLAFAMQAYMAGDGWLLDNIRIGAAIFLGSWIWIVTLSLTTLAISAALKKKMAARILMFGIFFILSTFGGILYNAIGLWWGMNIDITAMADTVMAGLFGTSNVFGRTPLWSAWGTLVITCSVALLFLYKKIKAYEIIR